MSTLCRIFIESVTIFIFGVQAYNVDRSHSAIFAGESYQGMQWYHHVTKEEKFLSAKKLTPFLQDAEKESVMPSES